MIQFSCTGCNHNYSVDDAHAGKNTKCKKCGTSLVVPAAPAKQPNQLIPVNRSLTKAAASSIPTPAPVAPVLIAPAVIHQQPLQASPVYYPEAPVVFVAPQQTMPAYPPNTYPANAYPAHAYPPNAYPTSPPPSQYPATKNCDFCGEVILQTAKKCKHCGEILDHTLRAVTMHAQAPAAPMVIVNQNVGVHQNNYVPGHQFSPLLAMFLSFLIPGLGQMYKGQPVNGLAWFILTLIGYVAFIVPGIVLHILCILGAGMR